MKSEKWLPIPCAPKYEINKRGDVRNIKTGKILSVTLRGAHRNSVSLYTDAGQIRFTINNLLWLTHGKILNRRSTVPLPVIVSKGNERHFFDTSREAAILISDRSGYAFRSVRVKLWRREKEISGWTINYQR